MEKDLDKVKWFSVTFDNAVLVEIPIDTAVISESYFHKMFESTFKIFTEEVMRLSEEAEPTTSEEPEGVE